MKKLVCLIIIAGIMLSISCSKTGNEGPQGLAGPSFTGSVIGNVSLFDEYGTRILTNLAGIKVSIIGNGTTKTTKTDSNGHYVLNSIVTGNYNFTYIDTTNTYAEDEAFDIQYIDGTVDRDVKMSQYPSFKLSSCTAIDTTILGINYLFVTCLDSIASIRPLTISVFVSSDSTASPNTNNYLLNYSETIKANKTQVSFVLPTTDMYGAGITSGQKAYIGIYAAAEEFASSSDYENLSNGREIYNALAPIPVTCNIKVQ